MGGGATPFYFLHTTAIKVLELSCLHVAKMAVIPVTVLLLLLASSSGKVVNITDSQSLKEYLCPASSTIAPNTDIIISVPLITLEKDDGKFCHIENTTNISISASQELVSSKQYAKVNCINNIGFGFFINKAHDKVSGLIPPKAVRYISHHFLYYNEMKTTLIFNHCCGLTLYEVVIVTHQTSLSVIGANLCGKNTVHSLNEQAQIDWLNNEITMLIYYTDTSITPSISDNIIT